MYTILCGWVIIIEGFREDTNVLFFLLEESYVKWLKSCMSSDTSVKRPSSPCGKTTPCNNITIQLIWRWLGFSFFIYLYIYLLKLLLKLLTPLKHLFIYLFKSTLMAIPALHI